jgi:hypothetical protein
VARIGKNKKVSAAGALPALLAVLSLLVQALISTSAMAYEFRSETSSRTVVLCTADGARSVEVPAEDHHKGFAGLKCHDCVMASLAGMLHPAGDAAPVHYSEIIRVELRRASAGRAIERPALRPPSQGPPDRFFS